MHLKGQEKKCDTLTRLLFSSFTVNYLGKMFQSKT